MKEGVRIEFHTAWCKGCGLCAAFCPTKSLAVEHGKIKLSEENNCVGCGFCEKICPDYVITVTRDGKEQI